MKNPIKNKMHIIKENKPEMFRMGTGLGLWVRSVTALMMILFFHPNEEKNDNYT